MAALQTFLNFSDRAASHKVAGAQYGALRRTLELLKIVPPRNEYEMVKALDKVKNDMDELAEKSPGIPSTFKSKIDARLKTERHKRIYDLVPNTDTEGDQDKH